MSAWGGKWHSSFDMHVMTQERGTHAPTTPTSTTFGTKSPHPSWQLAQLHELHWQQGLADMESVSKLLSSQILDLAYQ